jgi:hypothetical protein
MDKLTIFWSDKTSATFNWYLNQTIHNSSGSLTAEHGLVADQSLVATNDFPSNSQLAKTE